MSPVEKAALAWWRSHRPVGWTLQEHLEHPKINAGYRDANEALVLAVVQMLREQRATRTRGRDLKAERKAKGARR